MGDDESIGRIINTLDSVSKVFIILDSIKESEYKYIEIVNPLTNDPIMRIKLNITNDDMVSFLDDFFDNGFIVKRITKESFDLLETNDILNFNI